MRFHSLAFLSGLLLLSITSCSTLPQDKREASEGGLAGALSRADAASRTDLQSVENRRAYAAAVRQVVTAWQMEKGMPAQQKPLDAGTYRLTASWPKNIRFDELVPVTAGEKRQLNRLVRREGVGAPLVALWNHTPERKAQEPLLPESGFMVPVTATIDFRDLGNGRREARLRVHDSRAEETITLAGRRQPLAADFSAVSELILQIAESPKGLAMPGLGALRHSEKYLDKVGILSLEPPSPDRIPAIFVHGLMSRPLTWHNAFNELGADPVIAKNYQIYFFRYPSGVPVLYSSARFRGQLALLEKELHRIGNHRAEHNMVLIGHSMGGLVSKMQLTSTGDSLWVNIFGAKPSDLGLSRKEYEDFKQYLEFSPNPNVNRVIFVCTPHRGSKLAQGIVGTIGRKLVSLPGRILGTTFDILQGDFASTPLAQRLMEKGVPSSIENLSPEGNFVKQSMKLPLKPGLHVHSIIGNKDGLPLTDPKCSDGVVPYTSAHIEGAESELVVHSDHGAHETEAGIAEMRRILLLHLKNLPTR